jgi:hypothetical protein
MGNTCYGFSFLAENSMVLLITWIFLPGGVVIS